MGDNETQGKWEQVKGTVKENVGELTDNEKMEYEGKLEQGKGELREGVGQLQNETDEEMRERR